MALPNKLSSMGISYGLENPYTCFKYKNRWLFNIPGVSADNNQSGTYLSRDSYTTAVYALPPLKAARPSLEFKEQEVPHLIESFYYPIKPEWKPIDLVLYDLKKARNPVFEWMKSIYDPENGVWTPVVDSGIKRTAYIGMYDGCGNLIEKWILENAYPNSINWDTLEMGSSEIMTATLNIRYDRAYIVYSDGVQNSSASTDSSSLSFD